MKLLSFRNGLWTAISIFIVFHSQPMWANRGCREIFALTEKTVNNSEVAGFSSESKLTDSNSLKIIPRLDLPRKKLERRSRFRDVGYLGHEFLELNQQPFSSPDKFRVWVNEYTKDKNTVSLRSGDTKGGIDFNIAVNDISNSQSLADKYFSKIPLEFQQELIHYLVLLKEDVVGKAYFEEIKSGFKPRRVLLSIRTENFSSGFEHGHAHIMKSDMTYSLSPIGRGTEVDTKGRDINIKNEIQEEDYFKVSSPTIVSLIGRSWHRTPLIEKGEKRLLILVLFEGL